MKKIFIYSVFAVILFSGCSFGGGQNKPSTVSDSKKSANDIAEKVIEDNNGVDVTINGEGESGVGWPKSISSDVPEFKYGKLKVTFDGSKTEDTGTLIQIVDTEKDAFGKYAKDLRSNGWDVKDNVLKDYGVPGVRLEAKRGDLTVSLDKDPIGDNTAFLTIEKAGQSAPIE